MNKLNNPEQTETILGERPHVSLYEEVINSTDNMCNNNNEAMSETRTSNESPLNQSMINDEIINERPSTPERPSGPSLEERFHDPILNSASCSTTDVDMADSEVANIYTHEEFESLEDLTVYEVVTEYRDNSVTSTNNYQRIFTTRWTNYQRDEWWDNY